MSRGPRCFEVAQLAAGGGLVGGGPPDGFEGRPDLVVFGVEHDLPEEVMLNSAMGTGQLAATRPAVHRSRQVGVLRVGHRHRGERFRPEEASALGDVARRAATLLHAADLAADLQASMERIVVARERSAGESGATCTMGSARS